MYIYTMKLTEKQITRLITLLALEGSGAKGKLAKKMKCHPSQLSYIIKTGSCPKKHDKTITDYIK